jgi:plasmid stability protein
MARAAKSVHPMEAEYSDEQRVLVAVEETTNQMELAARSILLPHGWTCAFFLNNDEA